MVAADIVRNGSGKVTYQTLECETWWEAGLSLLFPKSFLSSWRVPYPEAGIAPGPCGTECGLGCICSDALSQ